MRCFLILVLVCSCLSPLYAQLDNSRLEQRFLPGTGEQRTLSLNLFSFNYFRNYEYFNEFADGLTYYGLQLRPELVYRPNKHFSLHGGILLSKDFGEEGFQDIMPVLAIRYEKNGISFINGAIDPHLSHGYIEPLFDYDKSITEPLEYGTQLKFARPRHSTDIWISWKNMIYKPSAEQEEILGGGSTSLHLLKKAHHSLSLPVQVLGWHRGGQIDTTSLPVMTLLNLAAGFEYAWTREGAVEKLFTKNYVLGFSSSSDQSPYEQGSALYLNAGLETRWLDAMFSYWQGHQFIAPAGAPVFQSVSSNIDHAGLKQDDRRLLFLRLKKDFTLADELFVSARLEPFWDFDGRYADYSMSLYLVYQGFFELFSFPGGASE
ncbi:hypothetical protein EDD80_1081 [Anseongella ginsenosidimutans]|uniref:Phosphate-selective porin O/P n=1 Tax=Anseongella ginsenosidimutans TaxID=496056 RepID=A0A4R3KNR6_9SPHI|nr:hypothetical protein [Anseongella ginsenosidimutans]QEC53837.1 hypothetical protein FRZ59_16865 [Anseongella ginsenosidimutans]TCS86210.1 hypothetical protein EDD80_1081 [Anseongella ginsenosidimutans]